MSQPTDTARTATRAHPASATRTSFATTATSGSTTVRTKPAARSRSTRARRPKRRGQRQKPKLLGGKRREYLREYLRWLWPHRYGVAALFGLALIGTGLQMIEPLFMRFIIDRVLLNTTLDTAARLTRLNLAGHDVPRR